MSQVERLSAKRKVSFKLPATVQLISIESDAKTFGQLMEDVANSVIADKIPIHSERVDNNYVRTYKFIEKNSLVEYGKLDDAVLPEGNIILFVTPVDHKAGLTINFEMDWPLERKIEAINNMSYNEIRSLGYILNQEHNAGISLSGSKREVINNIIEFLKTRESTPNFVEELELLKEDLQFLKEALFTNSVTVDLMIDKVNNLIEANSNKDSTEEDLGLLDIHNNIMEKFKEL